MSAQIFHDVIKDSEEIALIYPLFERSAQEYPDHIAVAFEDQQLTYSELRAEVNLLSQAILYSCADESIIAVSARRSVHLIISILAILKSGKAYLPLDPLFPVQRLAQIIADSGIKSCLCEASLNTFYTKLGLSVLEWNETAETSIQIPVKEQYADAYVLYTSGSTGTPKGVCMTQRSMVNLIQWQNAHSMAGPGSKTLQFAPVIFDVSFQEIFSTLTTGGILVLITDDKRLDPVNLLNFLTAQKIDRIILPFVALQFLAEAADSSRIFPVSVREIFTSGEQLKITPQIVSFFSQLPDTVLCNQYGPTETHVVTQLTLKGAAHQWPALPTIGKPIWNTSIFILDDDKNVLESGRMGELAVAGPSLASGYLHQPELTALQFIQIRVNNTDTRVYLTGDLARFLEDGNIEFLGRKDNQVKIRGYRIETGEVEIQLTAISGVKQAVVIAENDQHGQSRLLAYLVAAGTEAPSVAQVRKQLEKVLPEYMIPSYFTWLSDLPKTSSGKVDRSRLPAPANGRPDLAVLYKPAGSPAEYSMASVWATVLGFDQVGVDDNFFELGGNSLLALKTISLLRSAHHIDIPITKLYQYPTISQLNQFLETPCHPIKARKTTRTGTPGLTEPIAIIGMACRFPGADSIEELWNLLVQGKETITFFTPDDLDQSIPAAERNDPRYVSARGIIAGADLFDPQIFGINPKLAEVMDPQHRIFLEISRDVLEKTGYLPAVYTGSVGVFAGCGNNTYYPNNIAGNAALIAQAGSYQVMTANEKDYISSRTAFQLDLKGPAVSVFSACSTSLLAVTQAVESLRRGQCEVALAGGASVTSPIHSGHLYQEGVMSSRDGHCRPFDQDATGTVFSDGAGVVLLKSLSAARRDGDNIYGIIKGIGVNNDGSTKGSFTAPSATGQSGAIQMAMAEAGVVPADISYIEAHGTATPLGDPIEIDGLKMAFGAQAVSQHCAIGSIKGNMGHMTAAAGIAGLIKTALALHFKQLPPSLHFKKANPAIDFENSPFFVNSHLTSWQSAAPRRAGISSFGVGGTNVHVVLEENPLELSTVPEKGRQTNLFCWSAKSPESLKKWPLQLKHYIDKHPEADVSAIACTLQTTRQEFALRHFVVADDLDQLSAALENAAEAEVSPLRKSPGETVFLFPGQGAQFPGMGKSLYEQEPAYTSAVNECAEILKHYLEQDIRDIIFARPEEVTNAKKLNDTRYTQPALFVTSYALARLWMSWGLAPGILCGHSIGEYVAAHLAGVFSLRDALMLVAKRGQLVSDLETGDMLSVRASSELVRSILPDTLSIAAINSPKLCVVAGPSADIAAFELLLTERGLLHKKLATSHAFHSAMMDPVLPEFSALVRQVTLSRPRKPIVSTVTGQFLSDAEAMDPFYWTTHLRKTVMFSAALEFILRMENPVLLECGPGNTCTTLAWQHPAEHTFTAIASMEGKDDAKSCASLMTALGKLWKSGLSPDWEALYPARQPILQDLPTYSYHKKRFWADPAQPVANPLPTENTNNLTAMRNPKIIEKIKHILEEASGIEMGSVTADMSFIEIGLDSLLLTQLALTFRKEFSLPLTFRQLNEDLSTIGSLAAYLERNLPAGYFASAAAGPHGGNERPASDSALSLIAQQLQLLSRQVELMTGTSPVSAAAAPLTPLQPETTVQTVDKSPGVPLSAEELAEIKKPFGATARIERFPTQLEPYQTKYLEALTQRYNQRTASSKKYTQQHRPHMADPRVVSGFKPYTKEMVYSIVTDRSSGSHLWDIDGNEYIDALNGFGSNLLGYQHPVLKEAILNQVEKGYEIGPQHELAGEVARLICEFTGFDRAALCNTGSEAVLGAMRIARTVTGRSLIVAFTGSYHGINDEVIVRGTKAFKSFPAAPGIMPEAVENMLILDYGTEESLRVIQQRAAELAAVLVEPVQSRRPEFQPVEFLRQLREVTRQSDTLLILDEVITGFRAHPGGVNTMFGINADICTYGKVIGGGMPIGAIAGKKQYMDALDGGFWQYGDQSFPEVGVTYFAGTFVRHPLALAAGKAALEYMKDKGPELQTQLNQHTQYLANLLNTTIQDIKVPLSVVFFGSLWKIKFLEDYPYSELLFTLMREKGVHIWDGFPCFLTEAHTMEEIEIIALKFRESVEELAGVKLIPVSETLIDPQLVNDINTPPLPGARIGKDQHGNPAWFVNDPEHPGNYMQVVS